MNNLIQTLNIEHFRSIRQLKLEGLGRVNLITGRNNTGKSTILEALRIVASDASPSTLFSILHDREEDINEGEEPGKAVDIESFSQLGSLFNGFPAISEIREPIVVEANGGKQPLRLTITVGTFSEKHEPDGLRRLVPQQLHLFQDPSSSELAEEDLVPAFVIESNSSRKIYPLDYLKRFSRGRIYRGEFSEEPRMNCVFVSPYGGERTANLGILWDKIALSDREKDVIDTLKIVAPDIMAVSMVGSRNMRFSIVRSSMFPRPVPLRSFGDGLNRLFGIVLSLVNAKDGLLLIDEFENGMHHTVQTDVWRGILRLSRLLNVQVFATSHSWDAVQAFQKSVSEDPENGVLIRLSHKGNKIIPTMFREDELAIATQEHIEVR